MKTLMKKSPFFLIFYRLLWSILLFSVRTFSSTSFSVENSEGVCWRNLKTAASVMPQKICFSKIKLEKVGGKFAHIYFLNSDFNDFFDVEPEWNSVTDKYEVLAKGDYVNYSANCGLNIISQMNFKGFFDNLGKYVDHQLSEITIEFTYTKNNCLFKEVTGSEKFKPL